MLKYTINVVQQLALVPHGFRVPGSILSSGPEVCMFLKGFPPSTSFFCVCVFSFPFNNIPILETAHSVNVCANACVNAVLGCTPKINGYRRRINDQVFMQGRGSSMVNGCWTIDQMVVSSNPSSGKLPPWGP